MQIINTINRVLYGIDTLNEMIGKLVRWIIVALALVMCFEVFMRFVLNRPTIWAFEISTALYAGTFVMSAAWALLHKNHVCIDIFYEMLEKRGRAILDIITSIVFFFPFLSILLVQGYKFARHSWIIKETTWSHNAMPLYPVKSMIPIMAALLMLQGFAILVRSIMTLATGELHESSYKKEDLACSTVSKDALASAEEVEKKLKGEI